MRYCRGGFVNTLEINKFCQYPEANNFKAASEKPKT